MAKYTVIGLIQLASGELVIAGVVPGEHQVSGGDNHQAWSGMQPYADLVEADSEAEAEAKAMAAFKAAEEGDEE